MIQTSSERLLEGPEQFCLFFAEIEILSTVIKRIKCQMFFIMNYHLYYVFEQIHSCSLEQGETIRLA